MRQAKQKCYPCKRPYNRQHCKANEFNVNHNLTTSQPMLTIEDKSGLKFESEE
jgi:hypothetical protein